MARFTVLLLSCILIFAVFYKALHQILYARTLRRNGCRRPPTYPHKDLLFGVDLFYRYMSAFKVGNFLDFNKRMFDEHGKTFVARQFGSTIIRTIDPEVSKAVHSTYFANFGLQPLRYEVAKNLFGNGIIVVDGPHWQHGRALIRSTFDVAHISNFDRLHKLTEEFMNLLPNDGSTVDLMPLFRRLILDTSSDFILGESMGALAESDACTKFMEAFEYAQKGTAIRSMLGWFIFLHRDKKWWAACNHVTDFTDLHVEKALTRLKQNKEEDARNEKGPKSKRLRLIDEMAKDTQDRFTLRSHIISVFSPAHDGAAVTLSNALFHLSRNSRAVDKLRAEILPTKHELLNNDLLNSYKYLTWILKETHRLTTIATLNRRQCVKPTVLPYGGGRDGKHPLYVQEGDIVEINYRSMCWDQSFWGNDVDKFVPERWEHVRPGWEYTPFGGGPRTCPGQRLVFTESAFVLVTLIRKFKQIECRDSEPEWKEEMRMTFQSKNGCLVGLLTE